jgi:raffinose/stachyose/melibiose transport system substrate-binding protein
MIEDKHVSRRAFLRTTAAAGAAAGMGSLAPTALGGLRGAAEAASSRDYTGKFVVVGITAPTPGHGWSKVLNDFQSMHPGLSIDYLDFPSERFVALLTAAMASGEQIDVFQLNGQDLRRYALAGDLLPLDAVPFKSRFQQLGLQTYSIGGHLWALPSGSTGGFPIFYNNALLKKAGVAPPRTYADFVRMRDALAKQGASVFTHDGSNIYLWPVWFFTTYAQVTGNKSVERTFATLSGHGKFTDPDVVQALQLIFNFSKDKLFSPDVLSLDTDGATAEFVTGKAAFWLHYDGIINTVRTQNPPNMDLQVMLMPKLVNGAVKSQFPGGTGAALSIYSKIAPQRKAMAMQFLEYVTRDAVDSYLIQDAKQTLGTNVHAQGSTDPVALAEKALLPSMTIYLDWYWPPEITRAFQEGIQAGVSGSLSAQQVASDIQSVFAGLVANGYKFKH